MPPASTKYEKGSRKGPFWMKAIRSRIFNLFIYKIYFFSIRITLKFVSTTYKKDLDIGYKVTGYTI